jgi:hypothetical protein
MDSQNEQQLTQQIKMTAKTKSHQIADAEGNPKGFVQHNTKTGLAARINMLF